jgi:hypothetical protein
MRLAGQAQYRVRPHKHPSPMPADLDHLLESVAGEASFLAFAKALLADRIDEVAKEHDKPSSPYGPGANGWESGTIEQFLQGAVSWAEATSIGITQGLDSSNPWKRFALFLYCGKIYE